MIMMGYVLIIAGLILLIIGIVLFIVYIRQNWEISAQDFEQKIKASGIGPGVEAGSDIKRREIVKRLGIDEKKKDMNSVHDDSHKVNYYDKTEEIMD